nr:PREDICTED: carbohydrate sulfotransferase 11-like [Bemisia tabaci]
MKKYLRFSIYSGVTVILIVLWTRMVLKENLSHQILLKTAEISAAKGTESEFKPMAEKDIQYYLRKARRRNEERQLRVKQICEKYNLGIYRDHNTSSLINHPKTPLYKVFLINTTSKISWCPVEHGAFETWLFYFGLLSGYTEQELSSALDLQDFIRQKHPAREAYEIEEALQTTLKFMVVSHPFERILSLYKESKKSAQRTKSNLTQNQVQSKRDQAHNINSRDKAMKDTPLEKHSTEFDFQHQKASFQDFISYILDTEFDSTLGSMTRLTPYYLLCTPCLLKYQIIAKLETMMEDQIYIVKAADLQHVSKTPWRSASQAKPYSSHTGEERKKYFSQISKTNIYRLFEKYKLDFELFNYDFEVYLDWAS